MTLLFGCSVRPNSLRPHRLHHARLPWPSLCPRVCSNSCPLMPSNPPSSVLIREFLQQLIPVAGDLYFAWPKLILLFHYFLRVTTFSSHTWHSCKVLSFLWNVVSNPLFCRSTGAFSSTISFSLAMSNQSVRFFVFLLVYSSYVNQNYSLKNYHFLRH